MVSRLTKYLTRKRRSEEISVAHATRKSDTKPFSGEFCKNGDQVAPWGTIRSNDGILHVGNVSILNHCTVDNLHY